METGAAVATEKSAADVGALLAKCIQLDLDKKEAKKKFEDLDAQLDSVKEKIKDVYINMGVSSMKSGKKNVYISKQLWGGVEEGIDKKQLADVLADMNMADFITIGSQKLSSYIREQAKEHPEFLNSEGDITASPEEIIAALPEPLNTMFKATEKIDIRIRNSN